MRNEIEVTITKIDKISMVYFINAVRNANGLGLKEAKRIFDHLMETNKVCVVVRSYNGLEGLMKLEGIEVK